MVHVVSVVGTLSIQQAFFSVTGLAITQCSGHLLMLLLLFLVRSGFGRLPKDVIVTISYVVEFITCFLRHRLELSNA